MTQFHLFLVYTLYWLPLYSCSSLTSAPEERKGDSNVNFTDLVKSSLIPTMNKPVLEPHETLLIQNSLKCPNKGKDNILQGLYQDELISIAESSFKSYTILVKKYKTEPVNGILLDVFYVYYTKAKNSILEATRNIEDEFLLSEYKGHSVSKAAIKKRLYLGIVIELLFESNLSLLREQVEDNISQCDNDSTEYRLKSLKNNIKSNIRSVKNLLSQRNIDPTLELGIKRELKFSEEIKGSVQKSLGRLLKNS